MGGDRRARGRHAHAGIPRDESERPRAPARDRTRPAPRGVQRDAVLAGGGYALAAGRPSRSRLRHAVAVLRAVQSRPVHRALALLDSLSDAAGGISRPARTQAPRRRSGPTLAGGLTRAARLARRRPPPQ